MYMEMGLENLIMGPGWREVVYTGGRAFLQEGLDWGMFSPKSGLQWGWGSVGWATHPHQKSGREPPPGRAITHPPKTALSHGRAPGVSPAGTEGHRQSATCVWLLSECGMSRLCALLVCPVDQY